MSSITPKQVDVLVVGAGLSGLRAALMVQAAGYSCAVVEAIDRVGGKTLSVPSNPGSSGVNDIGAAWINDTTQKEMYQLLKKYGLHGEVQFAEGMSVMQLPNTSILHPHGELPFPEEDQLKVGSALEHIRGLVSDIKLDNPTSTTLGKDLDKVTVRKYCGKHFPDIVTGLAETIVQSLVGLEGDDISMLSFVFGCKSGTGIDSLISDGVDGAQYLRVREGTQSFSQNMARELQPESLYLSTPIAEIGQSFDTGLCTVRSSDQKVFQAKRVIVSVPSTLYKKIQFSPELPEAKALLARETTMGYYSKMIYVFEKPWWRNAELSGTIQSQVGPILFSRDTSVPSDGQWSITCFIVAESGRQWSLLSEKERKNAAWTQFREAFETACTEADISVPPPINVIEMEWSKEEFFGGAPCPAPRPGLLTEIGAASRSAPFGNVHFVGTETSTEWNGYMEGAVLSGDRGAQEVIEALGCR